MFKARIAPRTEMVLMINVASLLSKAEGSAYDWCLPMKTVLVPAGGGEADGCAFELALAVGRLLTAHLNFLHVRQSASAAALHIPHMGYAVGALRNALDNLNRQIQRRRLAAARNVQEFCARHGIAMAEKPVFDTVTAQWREESGDAMQCLILHARNNDLTVMARPTQSDGLPADRLETLLLECGRPLLVAPINPPNTRLNVAMVCWKETPDSARALSTAMPLLKTMGRVVVVSVREGRTPGPGTVDDLVNQLAWHGIDAESRVLSRNGASTAEVLFSVAQDRRVDLMIMGGYGHSHGREVLFGGCTQAALERATIPVFLMH
jgi:nucleotide-binding universal stress UspA family protein